MLAGPWAATQILSLLPLTPAAPALHRPSSSHCREAWYLEIGSGHHWLARRVPDGAFFVTGNQGRFKARPRLL